MDENDCISFQKMLEEFDIEGSENFCLGTVNGSRGVYSKRAVRAGEVLMRVPLSSCLLDDRPPTWFRTPEEEHAEDRGGDRSYYWTLSLAASMLDKVLTGERNASWRDLLPSRESFRETLPHYWDEKLLDLLGSDRLQRRVDALFFTRAAIVDELMDHIENLDLPRCLSRVDTKELCEYALDIVQTRTCRIIETEKRKTRILAPGFDFLNHDSNPSCRFWNDGDCLVVSSLHEFGKNDELTINYGESAGTAADCLSSYGFVPQFSSSSTAEIYWHGKSFDISPTSISFQLVETIAAEHGETIELNEFIVRYILKEVQREIAHKNTALALIVDEESLPSTAYAFLVQQIRVLSDTLSSLHDINRSTL